MEKEAIIEVKDLVKKYGQDEATVYALNHVSMKVYKGEFLIILGYSGSGKSTLLNMIGGIDKVNEGQIIYKGQDISKFKDRQLTKYRREAIGYIFQFFNLLSDITIYQNIVLAPSASKDKKEIERILDGVGLLDKKDKFPRQLSGGQQQRASIARALAKKSDMLLADEPTGALDYESGKDVLRLLQKLHKEGRTIVMVTHTKEITALANRIITMKNGQIIEERQNTPIDDVDAIDW
ncbi:MAG: ABC transporter ATP-binding protein [Candidatus Enterosoma sp.]|nr:ABC transporter ATP-binding protein [Bacilli bacterium]MDY3907679.1 ABC transporter ATP-binding protein [Candidatus Enterosoma sp.]MDY5649757.1 ABC transporter ATP-binding protein [Candidatus Enterosoma sp.]